MKVISVVMLSVGLVVTCAANAAAQSASIPVTVTSADRARTGFLVTTGPGGVSVTETFAFPGRGRQGGGGVPSSVVLEGCRGPPHHPACRCDQGGKTTGLQEVVYAGTERLKHELQRRTFQLKNNPPERQYVFGREDGSRIGRFDKTWHRLFGLAGLDYGRDKGLVWHTTRHEFISRVQERTGDPVVTQKLARHKDLRTTMLYMHPRQNEVLMAAAGLGRKS
jgi:hypothetical protein